MPIYLVTVLVDFFTNGLKWEETDEKLHTLLSRLIFAKSSQATEQPIAEAASWLPRFGWKHEKPKALGRMTTGEK